MRRVDYDSVAPGYDRRYREQEYGGLDATLLGFAGADPPHAVLEVGCGTGHWLGILKDRVAFLAGTDLSLGMLRKARSALPAVSMAQGRAEALPWRSGSFDRVFCVHAFHHFADQARFVAEARRVLRSRGGLMILGLDPRAGRDRWWTYDYFEGSLENDKARYPSAEQTRTAMAREGFSRIETREVQHVLVRTPAREALARGFVDRNFTSQLSVLSDAEYRRGVQRLEEAIEAAAARDQTLELVVDLHIDATVGWTPSP